MRALVALAKTGNFTLAAQYMHVTQSALSGLIKELEQTLGVRVVDCSTRRIALTDTGNELVPLFSQMIDDLDRALANIADQAQLRKGIVRVAVPLKPAHEVTYMTTALAMMASGLGVTVCMPYAAPLARLHGLRMLPLGAPVLTRRFFVYTREQR